MSEQGGGEAGLGGRGEGKGKGGSGGKRGGWWGGRMVVMTAMLVIVAPWSAEAKPPHIVFIVADDLGWNDVGFNNPDMITPNIDRLAHGGIILNQSYVQPVSTPMMHAMDWFPTLTEAAGGRVLDDPTERRDLADEMPEAVQRLEARLHEYRKQYVPANFPPNDPQSNPQLYGGTWTPGWR